MSARAQIDNWSDSDNKVCVDLVHKMLGVVNLFGYGEIRDGGYTSTLMGSFSQISDPRFVLVTITEKRDVFPALQKWFRRGGMALG